MPKHSLSMDVIRSVAGFGVVALHVTDYFTNYPLLFGGFSWWMANGINSLSRIAVPLFIMLSGYLLLDNSKKYSLNDILKKSRRLFIVLVIWTLIYFAWRTYWWHDIKSIPVMVNDFLNGFMHLYFLHLIIGLYLLTPLIKKILAKSSVRNKIYLAILASIVSAGITIANYLLKEKAFMLTGFAYSFLFIGYYIFGSVAKNVRVNKKVLTSLLSTFIILAFATAYLSYWNLGQMHLGNNVLWSKNLGQYFYDPLSINVILMSFIGFLLLKKVGEINFLSSSKRLANLFKMLAGLIFGIYLIHIIVLDLTNTLPHFREDVVVSPILLYITIKIFLVFVASALIIYFLKKVPAIKNLF